MQNPNQNAAVFLTGTKFGLLFDFRSMKDHSIRGNGIGLVNTQDGAQLEIDKEAT